MPPLLLKPPALKFGCTLGIVSPAAPSEANALEAGKALLESLGYQVKRYPHATCRDRYLAGRDDQRLADLHAAFADPDIDGILFARGGYGCSRLLPYIDWSLLRQTPKALMGFSDITVLLQAAYQELGLIGFYSPMLTSNLIHPQQDWTVQQWQRLMHGPNELPFTIANQDDYTCLRPGRVQGRLMGGNLTLLAALCGTPWQPQYEGAIVVIEDWKERYYTLDRQLTQLKQAGVFEGARAILFADFSYTELQPEPPLPEHLFSLVSELNLPCGFGFTVGHGEQTATIPIGVQSEFDAAVGQLQLLEAPFAR